MRYITILAAVMLCFLIGCSSTEEPEKKTIKIELSKQSDPRTKEQEAATEFMKDEMKKQGYSGSTDPNDIFKEGN